MTKPYPHPTLAFDRISLRESLRSTMDPKTQEIVLRFMISKLSEADLRELDDLTVGTSLDVPTGLDKNVVPAMDAAPGSAERKAYLAIGPSGRKSIRSSRMTRHRGLAPIAQDGAGATGTSLTDQVMFPHGDRLRLA